jgi:(4S)-4-hydroxy-5-phosphonooxypentane-2,3-dione isomerase
MLVVHVHVHVKPECVDAFKTATLENASASLDEPGVARFDVIQNQSNPTHFILVEAYETDKAPAAHKETRHYQKWRDTVAAMMAEPRASEKFDGVFPPEPGWRTPR